LKDFGMLTMLALTTILNNGPCLDSIKSVPQGLFGNDPSSAIVKIDKVVSTSTLIDGEVIGFVYTRKDGTTWLGQRKEEFMSAADSQAINAFFTSIHMPDATVTQFPPVRRYGVRTNYTEIFQVKVPSAGLDELRVRVEPCVAWPDGMDLPTQLP
jgi:hypothetical protein